MNSKKERNKAIALKNQDKFKKEIIKIGKALNRNFLKWFVADASYIYLYSKSSSNPLAINFSNKYELFIRRTLLFKSAHASL